MSTDFRWRTSSGKVNLEELGLDGSNILKWVQSVYLQSGSFVLVRPRVIENRVIIIGPDQKKNLTHHPNFNPLTGRQNTTTATRRMRNFAL